MPDTSRAAPSGSYRQTNPIPFRRSGACADLCEPCVVGAADAVAQNSIVPGVYVQEKAGIEQLEVDSFFVQIRQSFLDIGQGLAPHRSAAVRRH